MADIYISYDINDYSVVKKIATYLTNQGLTVWWDVKLKPNSDFDKKSEKELYDAAQVIVLWSQKSSLSDRVKKEAEYAKAEHKLASFQLDKADIPKKFKDENITIINENQSDLSVVYEQLEQLPRVKIRDTIAARASAEARLWADILTSDNKKDYDLYLEEFPTGTFVEAVKEKLEELDKQKEQKIEEKVDEKAQKLLEEAGDKNIDEMLEHYQKIDKAHEEDPLKQNVENNIKKALSDDSKSNEKKEPDLQLAAKNKKETLEPEVINVSSTSVQPNDNVDKKVAEVKLANTKKSPPLNKALIDYKEMPDTKNIDKIIDQINEDTNKAQEETSDTEIPDFMKTRPNWESSLDRIKKEKQQEIEKKEAATREKEIKREAERLKNEELKKQKEKEKFEFQRQKELEKKKAAEKKEALKLEKQKKREEEKKHKIKLRKEKQREKKQRNQHPENEHVSTPIGTNLSYKSVENEVADFGLQNIANVANNKKSATSFPWLTLVALVLSLGITAFTFMSVDILESAKKVIADLDIEKRLKGPIPIKDCENCPEMIIVPSGKFMMGAPAEQVANDQKPQREVTIAKSFAVGRFEVKFSEWDFCVKEGGCRKYKPRDETWGRGEHPVINVSWEDAKSYVKWLSKKTGIQYRLLSEAEWEYAARAGTQTPFAWGNHISHRNANFDRHNSRTVPVNTYWPNSFSLYQMYGNVWEHVEDCWHGNYKNAPTDGSAWLRKKAGNCSRRVIRGGSFLGSTAELKASYRSSQSSTKRSNQVGFRVARDVRPDELIKEKR